MCYRHSPALAGISPSRAKRLPALSPREKWGKLWEAERPTPLQVFFGVHLVSILQDTARVNDFETGTREI